MEETIMNKHALKEYIENMDFIRKMDEAFSDLRADYELSMDTDNKKIEELLAEKDKEIMTV